MNPIELGFIEWQPLTSLLSPVPPVAIKRLRKYPSMPVCTFMSVTDADSYSSRYLGIVAYFAPMAILDALTRIHR